MKTKKKVQLNLFILQSYKNLLTRIAAERMLKNPGKSITASRIGAEILCEYLDRMGKETLKKNGAKLNDIF